MTDTRQWFKILLDFSLFEMSDDEVIYYPSIMEVLPSPYGDAALDEHTATVAVAHATQAEVEHWSDQHTQLTAEMADITEDERRLTEEYRKRRQLILNRRNAAFEKYRHTQKEIQRRIDDAVVLRMEHGEDDPTV